MATLRVFSGGAAQAVVEKIAAQFKKDTGHDMAGEFSAVGAMRDKVVAGEAVDVVILTVPLIEELIGKGLIVAGTRADLGRVGTGVAVRAGMPVPDVSNADVLRSSILAASRIVCPDPAVATAGKVVMAMLDKLGIAAEVKGRMQFFPNGYAAMGWLASSTGTNDIGITQVTEILPNKGVTLAGQLPEALQSKATYSAGLAARAANPELARDFIARLSSPDSREIRLDAGFEL